jgi:nucleotide-binding universal stress UspA family protein
MRLREIKPAPRRCSNNAFIASTGARMTYRSLLVHLDADRHCADRTDAAIRLAAELDSHLVGLAPTGLIDMPAFAEMASSLSEYASLAWDTLREQAEQAAVRFREQCRAAGVRSFEAVVDAADKAASLVRHAHCSDAIVMSQVEPDSQGHATAQAVLEQVVLYSARPTLILPYAGRFETIGSNVLVAWDDSREAARALSDALPLLRRARSTQVVTWTEGGPADDALRPRLDALAKWLLWQGVSVEVFTETTDIDIADAMLSRAADFGADLIVMGAYGHARWSERMLGGATRGLLDSMTVPVLMSR